MTRLFIDLETFSEVPIRNGTFAYSEGAEIMLWAFAFEDGPIYVWDLTSDQSIPAALQVRLANPSIEIIAHNAAFDRTILEKCGYHTDLKRWRCTMARAFAHSLPGSLATLSDIFNLGVEKAKGKEGKKLINLFCMSRKTGAVKRATAQTHPEEWQQFIEYARLDIAALRELDKKLPNWNYDGDELALWHLDQTINRRGMQIDKELVDGAITAVNRAQKSLAERTDDISLGLLQSTTQRDETLKYLLAAYGVDLPDLQASTVERRLEDPELPTELKELLGIRLQASSTSTAKYGKLRSVISTDGRIRGTIQYCGAGRTGRFCLAEGSPVLVKNENAEILEKPIEKVLITDLTWDGDSWVTHAGVVFSGDKEVIEYDGVLATPEHNVYVSSTEYLPLGEAKRRSVPLWRGNRDIQSLPDNVSE